MSFLKKLPIRTQFALVLSSALAVVACSVYVLGSAIAVNATVSQARTVADMVDNVGALVSGFGGVWARSTPGKTEKVGSFLQSESYTSKVAKSDPNNPTLSEGDIQAMQELESYHFKNPALFQRELSDITQKSGAKAKFRMVSDHYMNPNNAPNDFEKKGIATLRAEGPTGAREYYEVENGQLLYSRQLIAKASCLKCHSTPEAAPEAVRTKYPDIRGYGYEEGKLAGIISVSIPVAYNPTNALVGANAYGSWAAVGAIIASFIAILAFLQRAVVRPIIRLREQAKLLATADLSSVQDKLVFVDAERTSNNEVHTLNNAIHALYTSIRVLTKLHGQQEPTDKDGGNKSDKT
jgi:HAMP domain-containing protein